MPIEVQQLSLSQFCELLAIDPARLVGIVLNKKDRTVGILLEPSETEPRSAA